jgi:hypothetical protein
LLKTLPDTPERTRQELNKTPYGRTLGTSELSSGTSSLCG